MIGIVRDKDNKEIKRVQNPSRDWMVKQLNENVCQVLFKKKLNGQFRSLKCTRRLEHGYRYVLFHDEKCRLDNEEKI